MLSALWAYGLLAAGRLCRPSNSQTHHSPKEISIMSLLLLFVKEKDNLVIQRILFIWLEAFSE
jgi:hypothetical protein